MNAAPAAFDEGTKIRVLRGDLAGSIGHVLSCSADGKVVIRVKPGIPHWPFPTCAVVLLQDLEAA